MQRLVQAFIVLVVLVTTGPNAVGQTGTGGVPFVVSAAGEAEQAVLVAQLVRKRRSLFDLLFGRREEPQQQAAPATGGATSSRPTASLPPAKPKVEKAEGATKLAVFGDSLASELARALQRAYADDPNLVVVAQGVGSSGMVRDDYFDWNAAIAEEIADNSFDIAVMIIGINDRQELKENGQTYRSLTEAWKHAYAARLNAWLGQMRAANKPVVWVGLPPMRASSYSEAMTQISSLHKLAAYSGGAEFVDIYERFVDENGAYSQYGPDLNGQTKQMRNSDGIHFTSAGADKLAFFVTQALKRFYSGGTVTINVADLLAGTDAANLVRMPFQGLGQTRLLEIAGAVMPLTDQRRKAGELVWGGGTAGPGAGFDLDDLMEAPSGRGDSFGLGVEPVVGEAAE